MAAVARAGSRPPPACRCYYMSLQRYLVLMVHREVHKEDPTFPVFGFRLCRAGAIPMSPKAFWQTQHR